VLDIIDRFRGGEAPESVGRDVGVPSDDVIELIRAFYTAQPEAA
jgi:hypothetical protein